MRASRTLLGKWFKGVSRKTLLAASLQVMVIGLLLLGFARNTLSDSMFLSAQAVLSLVYFFLLVVEFRRVTGREFKAYFLFFAGVWLFVQAAWFFQSQVLLAQFNYSVWLLAGLISFFSWFRLFFSKRVGDAKGIICDR